MLETERTTLRTRIGDAESEQRKRIEAVKAENEALSARLRGFEPHDLVEAIPFPPVGLGLLMSLKQSNRIVRITVSSHASGSVDNLPREYRPLASEELQHYRFERWLWMDTYHRL
jgi:hypothetical protein